MQQETIKERLRSSSKSEPKDINMAGTTSTPSSSSKKERNDTIMEDVTTEKIWSVLQQLVQTVDGIKTQLETDKGMPNTFDSFSSRLNSTKELLSQTVTKLNLVGNMLMRQEEKIESIQSDIKDSRRQKMRPNLIVKGVIESMDESRQQCADNAKSFFKEQMEITQDIPIKKAYRLGPSSKTDRPILVRLDQAQDKSLIYESVSKLKGKANVKKKLYFIEDDLDQEQAETKFYMRDLKRENELLKEDERVTIKMHKGAIYANNEKIKQQLLPPTDARLLSMSESEMSDIKAVKLFKSEEFTEKGSDYIAYVQKVKTVKEVQKGLYKMRVKYADATHISCAYRLHSPNGPFNQSYFDDGEYGAGRAILQAIKDRDLICVTVFIVRFYGGIKLGKRHFDIASMLTTAALSAYQFRANRHKNAERNLSQQSLASVLSVSSESDSVIQDTNRDGATSQDDDYATPAENLTEQV